MSLNRTKPGWWILHTCTRVQRRAHIRNILLKQCRDQEILSPAFAIILTADYLYCMGLLEIPIETFSPLYSSIEKEKILYFPFFGKCFFLNNSIKKIWRVQLYFSNRFMSNIYSIYEYILDKSVF